MEVATFESEKAAQWDQESVAEGETSALAGTAGVQSPGNPQGMSNPASNYWSRNRGRGRGRGRGSDQRGGGIPRGLANADFNRGGSHPTSIRGGGSGRATSSTPQEGRLRDKKTGIDRPGRSSASQGITVKTVAWAKPPPLVTVAQKERSEEEAARIAAMKQYLRPPKADERFTAIGIYQWPLKATEPSKLLGDQLKDLNRLRTDWKIYIEWDAAKKCILIRSASPTGSGDIIEVMEGIRQATESARARSLTAAPLYIVAPPEFSVESTVLLATVDSVARSDGKKHLYDIRFCKQATTEQLKDYYPKMKEMAEINGERLHKELSTQLKLNKFFKNKMRMRINFGRLHLTHWQTSLSDCQQTFGEFVKMMGKRTRIASIFDNELDAQVVATLIQKIKTKTTMFLPFDGKLATLSDVEPVHIVLFTVETSSGKKYRIEADIDKVDGGYQSGCCRAFDIEERDPSLEIISMDIEKQVDWDLEIVRVTVSDKIYPSFESIVKNCLDKVGMRRHEGIFKGKVGERQDITGLCYPQVFAHAEPGLKILDTSLCSTYRYLTAGGYYCVELVMNRKWIGMDTRPEPTVASGVAVYHPNWDIDMDSIEHANYERSWPNDMSNFFPEKTKSSRGGLLGLTEVLEYMRRALSNPSLF
ncbi:hypothetical protein ACMFMG_003072 [Clarireedia jacksonii]